MQTCKTRLYSHDLYESSDPERALKHPFTRLKYKQSFPLIHNYNLMCNYVFIKINTGVTKHVSHCNIIKFDANESDKYSITALVFKLQEF